LNIFCNPHFEATLKANKQTNRQTKRIKQMLSNIATVLNRRRFRFVFAALSLFFFIFSRKADAFYQENNNLGRSLLQDHHHSSAHAEWQGMKMDEKGEFWDRVGGHFDHRNRRREEEEGPLR